MLLLKVYIFLKTLLSVKTFVKDKEERKRSTLEIMTTIYFISPLTFRLFRLIAQCDITKKSSSFLRANQKEPIYLLTCIYNFLMAESLDLKYRVQDVACLYKFRGVNSSYSSL